MQIFVKLTTNLVLYTNVPMLHVRTHAIIDAAIPLSSIHASDRERGGEVAEMEACVTRVGDDSSIDGQITVCISVTKSWGRWTRDHCKE